MTAVRIGDPFAVQRSDDGTVGISASDARHTLNALLAQSAPGRTYSGVIPQGTDATTKTPAGLIVSPMTPASNQLQVSPGSFVVQSDAAASAYIGYSDKLVTLTVPPADATNARTDLAVAWVEDSDAGEGTGKGSFIDVYPGPADGTKALPTNLPSAHTVLASWETPAGTSTVIANVSNARAFATSVGGMRVHFDGIGVDDEGYPGQPRVVVNSDGTFSLDLFNPLTMSWVPIASKVIPWTPKFVSDNGAVNLGNGGYATGYYMRFVGGLTFVFINLHLADGCDAGYGDVHCQFPPGIVPLTAQRTLASLFIAGWAAFTGQAYFNPSSANISPVFPDTRTDTAVSVLRSATGGYNPGTGIPQWPGQYTMQPGFDMIVSGTILAQQ